MKTVEEESVVTMIEADAEVLLARREIEAAIGGRTLISSLAATAAAHGKEPAYSDRHGAESSWRTMNWRTVREMTLDVAAGLIAVGVEPGERVCIMARNCIEHVIADSGAMHAGAVPVSVYLTLAPEQVVWYARHAAPSVVVLEGSDQLARWSIALADPQVVANLRAVIVIDAACAGEHRSWDKFAEDGQWARHFSSAALGRRMVAVRPDDPATILYTSGTTGDPKGVVLTHHNILYEVEAARVAADFTRPGITVSYLPLAHVAERLLGLYVPQVQSGHVHLIGDPAELVSALAEVRPTRFFGVPRVWEKIMTGVSARLSAETDEQRRAAVAAAMQAGRAHVESRQVGESTSPEVEQRFAQCDAAVLAPIRALLGLDRAEWTVSAAAPMPLEVANFFAGLGLAILDVYGMSETTASVTAGTPSRFRLGTVGRPLPGIELRLADDGEIFTRGPVVTPGYLDNPGATAALIDADGWVHTGDIGELDDHGMLRVIDRKKELIVTSSGKNIAPSIVENHLKESPLIGHAMVVGDSRPYLVALLTLDAEIAPLVAARMGIDNTDIAALAEDPRILAAVQEAVDAANARLSRPEQVKRFQVLSREWTAESEELTPTLKLKRRVVNAKYAERVAQMYARAQSDSISQS